MHIEEKILFVVNPAAGGKDKALFWTSLEQALALRRFDYLSLNTNGKNDVGQLRQMLQNNAFTRVIAVGGDGTVKLVAEQLIGGHRTQDLIGPTGEAAQGIIGPDTGIALGIIPMGSANGMARELGLPTHPKDALNVALGASTIQIDAIDIENHGLCVHLCDLGLNATIVENYQAEGLRGMWGYARVFLRTVLQRNRFRIYLVNETLRLNRNVFMVMLANARMFGTGALINPTGSLRDGLFEVIMIKEFRWLDLPRLFIANRKHYNQREEVVSVKSIHIACRRPMHFQVDGEYKGKVTQVKASIIEKGLRVLVPPRP
jgi:diacylglycerol kinase (ATP)